MNSAPAPPAACLSLCFPSSRAPPPLLRPAQLLRALKAVRKLHTDHTRDSGEMVLLAMQHGTFDKAVEFVDFRDRLAASLTFAACSAELAAATGLHAVPQQLPQGKGAAAAAPLALSLLGASPQLLPLHVCPFHVYNLRLRVVGAVLPKRAERSLLLLKA